MKYQFNKNKFICLYLYLTLFLSACVSTEHRETNPLSSTVMIKKQTQNVGGKKSLPKVIISENEQRLLNEIQAIPKLKNKVDFVHNKKGGFFVNGEIYTDSEGKIEDYIFNTLTGDVYYLIKNNEDEEKYTIKYTRVLTDTKSIIIANIVKSMHYEISTASGDEIIADKIRLNSDGFSALRLNSIYNYRIGYGVTSSSIPNGWHIAKYQNSRGTNYILLERNIAKTGLLSGSEIGELIDITKELFTALGLSKKQDYMLINTLDSSKHKILNITLGGKDVQKLKNCEYQNKYISKCHDMDSKKSPFEYSGKKNIMHYYWRTFWFDTDIGTLVVSLEKTNTKVMVTNLDTGKELKIASNFVGFPSIDVIFNKDKTIDVIAFGNLQLFGKTLLGGEEIKNIESLFKSTM